MLEHEGVLPSLSDLPVRQLEGRIRGQLPHRPLFFIGVPSITYRELGFHRSGRPRQGWSQGYHVGGHPGALWVTTGPSYSAQHSMPHPGNTPRWGMGRRCSLKRSRPLAGLPRAQLDGAVWHLGAASSAWIPVLGAGRGLGWWIAGAHAAPPPHPFLQTSV